MANTAHALVSTFLSAPWRRKAASDPAPMAPHRPKLAVDWEVDLTDDTLARRIGALRELAMLQYAMMEHRNRLAAANEPVDRLTKAKAAPQRVIAQTRAAIAALDLEERQALERWADRGEGEKPAPRTDDRSAVERRHADATRELADIAAAMQPFEERRGAVAAEGHKLRRSSETLVANILLEEAEVLGHRYIKAIESVVQITEELFGINDALMNFLQAGVQRHDVPSDVYRLPPNPAICEQGVDLAAFAIRAKGFALRANNYQDIVATPLMDRATNAMNRWLNYASSLLSSPDDDEDQLRARARLIGENADLKEQLMQRALAATESTHDY